VAKRKRRGVRPGRLNRPLTGDQAHHYTTMKCMECKSGKRYISSRNVGAYHSKKLKARANRAQRGVSECQTTHTNESNAASKKTGAKINWGYSSYCRVVQQDWERAYDETC